MNSKSSIAVDLLPKVEGTIIGAAVGDALGWPQEQRSGIKGGQKARLVSPQTTFREWVRQAGSRFNRYDDPVRRGEYSDDTQLLLAVARACLSDEWDTHLSRVELPAWILYQRGGGRAVLSAARSWAVTGKPPWYPSSRTRSEEREADYFARGANGVAMRIAPHAIVTATDSSSSRLIHRVIRDGIYTHGHPRALIGAIIHALALRYALTLRGTLRYSDLLDFLYSDLSWQDSALADLLPASWKSGYQLVAHEPAPSAWQRTVDETRALLEIALLALERGAAVDDEVTLARLGCFDTQKNGAGHITAVASVYIAARAATRPMSGLLLSAFLSNADTDTLASMTASLLGALHGADWLHPLADQVQDSTYLKQMSRLLLERTLYGDDARSEGALLTGRPPVSMRDIDRFKEELAAGETDKNIFLDGRTAWIEEKEKMSTASNSYQVTRWRLRTVDGQSLILDRVSRDRRSAPPSQPVSEFRGSRSFAQQSLFHDPVEHLDAIYDPSMYSTREQLAAALATARREIQVREEFRRLYSIAAESPMSAIIESRGRMESFLTELTRHNDGTMDDRQPARQVIKDVRLSKDALDDQIILAARDIWRMGASIVHGRTPAPTSEVARDYVDAAERVAIQVVRFHIRTHADSWKSGK
ncbi:ADP-ribosylglycohydrolase family protein [Microtetraspora niveoalba]|uniref:ADP-ribosylglycohydrolase family protein n=1 Tax=Microtetraspora niveoalba TaxID=46175 RepID=UPI000A0087E7|nr:ADP-ribosylglycohydrolase family protein [Microtetraspora niveoalba]